MSDLFSNIAPWAPKLPDAKMRYFENFIPKEIADDYYNTLLENIPWQQDKINIFGKTHLQPRLTSLHSSNLKSYTYFPSLLFLFSINQILHLKKLA